MDEHNLNILIVEDDLSWQMIYKFKLSQDDISVDLANNKQEALVRLDQNSYDVIIVDIRLVDEDQSNFDGIEVIRYLRTINSVTTIVVKSGFLSVGMAEELMHLGVNHVLDKTGSSYSFDLTMEKVLSGVRAYKSGQ